MIPPMTSHDVSWILKTAEVSLNPCNNTAQYNEWVYDDQGQDVITCYYGIVSIYKFPKFLEHVQTVYTWPISFLPHLNHMQVLPEKHDQCHGLLGPDVWYKSAGQ